MGTHRQTQEFPRAPRLTKAPCYNVQPLAPAWRTRPPHWHLLGGPPTRLCHQNKGTERPERRGHLGLSCWWPPHGSLSDAEASSGWERGCPSRANQRMPLGSHGNCCRAQSFRIDSG